MIDYSKVADLLISQSSSLRNTPPQIIADALQCGTVEYWRFGACLRRIEIIAGGQTSCGNLLKNEASGKDCERGGLLTSVQCQSAQVAGILRQARVILEEDPGADIVVQDLRKLNSRN